MKLYLFFTKILMLAAAFNTDLQANLDIGIITFSAYAGELEIAWRIKIAGEALGWNVFVDETKGSQLNDQELDCVICMLPHQKILNNSYPNYLMVFHPFNFLNSKREFNPNSEEYDGFLLTIHDRDTLKEGLKKKCKTFHYTSFYPTIYSIPYKKLELNDLFLTIPVWGNRLEDPKFQNLYQLLSQSNFTKFYGTQLNNNIDPKNYMGFIPFNGVYFIEVLQDHGIALVFHSDIHNQEAIPSARIFEAAAASAVIISDENEFVKKHFGDSVFYVDMSATAESIFNQIQNHMSTIFQNPEGALAMAKNAHEIFNEKFSMESQLINFEKMHREVMLERKINE